MTDTNSVSGGALPISTDQKVWGSNPYGRAQPNNENKTPEWGFCFMLRRACPLRSGLRRDEHRRAQHSEVNRPREGVFLISEASVPVDEQPKAVANTGAQGLFAGEPSLNSRT